MRSFLIVCSPTVGGLHLFKAFHALFKSKRFRQLVFRSIWQCTRKL